MRHVCARRLTHLWINKERSEDHDRSTHITADTENDSKTIDGARGDDALLFSVKNQLDYAIRKINELLKANKQPLIRSDPYFIQLAPKAKAFFSE